MRIKKPVAPRMKEPDSPHPHLVAAVKAAPLRAHKLDEIGPIFDPANAEHVAAMPTAIREAWMRENPGRVAHLAK
jgi:hypothetical protein